MFFDLTLHRPFPEPVLPIFNPEKEVVSLCYTGNTFINNSSFRGRLKETTQMGVERMGDDSPEADAEILAMTVECLLATGLTEFQGKRWAG